MFLTGLLLNISGSLHSTEAKLENGLSSRATTPNNE
jgi:hypothetical protein